MKRCQDLFSILRLEETIQSVSGSEDLAVLPSAFCHGANRIEASKRFLKRDVDEPYPQTASPPAPQVVPGQVFAAISVAVIESAVRLDAADTALKVMKRRWKDADVYLFFNEGNRESEHAVALFSKGRSVGAWDALWVTVTPVDSASKGGHPRVHLNVQPYKTRVILVG